MNRRRGKEKKCYNNHKVACKFQTIRSDLSDFLVVFLTFKNKIMKKKKKKEQKFFHTQPESLVDQSVDR